MYLMQSMLQSVRCCQGCLLVAFVRLSSVLLCLFPELLGVVITMMATVMWPPWRVTVFQVFKLLSIELLRLAGFKCNRMRSSKL